MSTFDPCILEFRDFTFMKSYNNNKNPSKKGAKNSVFTIV